jgi:hypothetical protein
MQPALIAIATLACSPWSLAFAGDAALANPKTAQTPYASARVNPIPLAPPANDDCSAAQVVVGYGPFPFSTIGATTGTQQGLGCGSSNSYDDVWYSWTANFTGQCQFTLCNGGVNYDSLIAVYNGSSCPTPGSAIGCNDDSCGTVSRLAFAAVSGQNYLLQIGAWAPTGSGSGSFELSPPAPPPPPCIDYDDGSVENLLGWTAGGDMVWLNRFGTVGVQTTILSVEVQWPMAFGPVPTNVLVWQDDPSQDGLPGTSTLLLDIPTTTSGAGAYVTFPAPLTIMGRFFVGTHQPHLAGQFVAPIDQTTHAYVDSSWFFGVNVPGQLANYANPGANVQPPLSLDQIGFPGQFLVRVNCLSGPPILLCDPGSAGTQACPCSNPPSGPGRGCNNSSNTGGASISGSGNASVAASTLIFTTAGEKPTALSILLQGNAVNTTGIVFGQGVRCAAGLLKRLYAHNAVGGSIIAPSGTDQDIATRSAILGDPIVGGQSRWYMVYYRDASVLGACLPFSTFNDTDTAAVLWVP